MLTFTGLHVIHDIVYSDHQPDMLQLFLFESSF